MPNSKDTIGYNELDELLRENVEHILICVVVKLFCNTCG